MSAAKIHFLFGAENKADGTAESGAVVESTESAEARQLLDALPPVTEPEYPNQLASSFRDLQQAKIVLDQFRDAA